MKGIIKHEQDWICRIYCWEARHFRGRNAEQIRFQKGDIVEIYRGDEVKLAIVVGHRAVSRPAHDDARADDRLARSVFDVSPDGYVLRPCEDAHQEKQG